MVIVGWSAPCGPWSFLTLLRAHARRYGAGNVRRNSRWGTAMAGMQKMSLDAPEESRPFKDGKGRLDLVNTSGGSVGRGVFEPGWRWSDHVKPIAGTDSCQASHLGYYVSGRMRVVMDDGEDLEFGPGDFAAIPPGHDAWIVGDEPCVFIDWQGFSDYAKQ